jgi:sRNA-binding protein
VIRRREQTREVLALLRAHWPALFAAPVPLATGIEREIRAGLGETRVPSMRLGRALHYWMHGPGYLAAIAAGRRRLHLDGTDAGEPDEAQRQHAREIIAQRAARRAAGTGRQSARQPESGNREP